MKNQSSDLFKALAVTAELTNTQLSTEAIKVMVNDLSAYDENSIVQALAKCRRELKGRITVAEIISRIDDGRPGVEQAWAIVAPCLNDESRTIIWTHEMRDAFGIALNLANDPIAARMAFKESYQTNCQKARDAGIPIRWIQCFGHDPRGRDGQLLEAVKSGKLTAEYVYPLLVDKSQIDLGMLKLAQDTQQCIE